MKKILSLLLAVLMVVGMFPMTAFAEEAEVFYTGSDWPYKYYYVEKIEMTGAKIDRVEGTDVYLDSSTAKDAELTFTVTAGGRQSDRLGINWNGGSEDTKTYTANLADGTLKLEVYAYSTRNSAGKKDTKVFNFYIAEANEIPVLADGYSAEASAEVTSGEAYNLNLNEVFSDADGDELSYTVSVNGAAATAAEAEYSYLNNVPGTHTLKFTATDGKTAEDKLPSYTVALTVKNSSVTYDVNANLPEGVSPKFYAVNDVTDGAAVKGDELVFENGTVKVPENISRIMWEAEGKIGFSAPVSAGANLEIAEVTFEVKTDLTGELDTAAAIEVEDSEGVKTTGTVADSYLLPVLSGFTYKATPSVSGYNGGELTEQTPASGKVEMTVNAKHFTVIAPKGSVVSAGTLSGSFAYTFAEPLKSETVDETVVYKFSPLSGNAFIRVQNPDNKDAVTYWNWKSSKADGATITVTEEMLFMNDSEEDKYDSDTVYRHFEKYEMDLGDIYMNINNQGYVNINVGDVKALNMFRNWQAINGFTNDKIALPDFSYEIINIEGENVISIVPDENNSGAATMTATGEGTAIVLVTYDAMYCDSTVVTAGGGAGGGNRYSAIWPDRTGVFVVSVGKDGTAIQSNMTCNGAVFDAEHSPQFYTGNEGAEVSFKPEEGVTVTVNRSTVGTETLSFGEFTTEGVTVAEDGTVTVSGLTTGRHIIKLEKGGVASYQVVTATQTTVTFKDSEGNVVSENSKFRPGETLSITVTGLTNPAEKFATKYNFNAQITYNDQNGNAFKNSSGTGYGQYNFSAMPQVINITIPEDATEDLVLNGYIQMGGFAGDGIGSHRKVSYGTGSGMATGTDAGMVLGTLPEIIVKVLNGECEHEWIEATCYEPKKCSVCRISEGEPLGHDWSVSYEFEKGTVSSEDFKATVDGNPVVVAETGKTEGCIMDPSTPSKVLSVKVPEGSKSLDIEYLKSAYMVVYCDHEFNFAIYENNTTIDLEKYSYICVNILDNNYNGEIFHIYLTEGGEAEEVTVCSATHICGNDAEHNETAEAVATGEVVKEPTCSENGVTKYTAVFAEDWAGTYTEEIADIEKLPHTEVIDEAVEPTCTETGLTEGKHCSVCNEVLVAQTVVDALGHDMVTDEAKEPTCTETGLTEGKHCSVCNEVLVAQTVVPALGHTEVIDEAVEPTCTETGLTEGKHCSVCNEVLVAQTVVDALGHDMVTDEAKEPTCTETGLTEGSHCSRCDDATTAQNIVPALGHKDENPKDYICDVCNEDLCDEDDHQKETISAVAPTCTETGLTEGEKCSICGEILKAQEVVDALGHDMADATCTESAACKRCDHTEGEALGHDFGPWVTVEHATENRGGRKVRTCEVCGQQQSKHTKPLSQDGITDITPADKEEESNPNTGAPVFDMTFAGVVVLAATAVVIGKKKK